MYLLSFWGFVDSLLKYLPLAFLAASAICFYKGYQASADKSIKKVISSGGGVFGVLLLLAAIGSAFWMWDGKMIYLIPIALLFVPLIIKLVNNFNKWKENIPVDHNKEWKWVAVSTMCTSGLFFIILDTEQHTTVWKILLSIAVVGGMIASWFWITFDGFFNIIRRRYAIKQKWQIKRDQYTWWYTGSDDNDDAATDNFLQRLKLWQHIAIKLLLIGLFTYLYVI